MTTIRSFRWGLALVSLPLCILLVSTAYAQDVPPEEAARIAALFQAGMTVLEIAERTDSDDARHDLYDKATQAFRAILVNHPELVRVRLELARTFFLKGQDGLARRHFEAVLAGGVPAPVAANIQRFLAIMQSRKRLTGYFCLAVRCPIAVRSDTGVGRPRRRLAYEVQPSLWPRSRSGRLRMGAK